MDCDLHCSCSSAVQARFCWLSELCQSRAASTRPASGLTDRTVMCSLSARQFADTQLWNQFANVLNLYCFISLHQDVIQCCFWPGGFRSRVNEVIVLFYRFIISSATLHPSHAGILQTANSPTKSTSAGKSGWWGQWRRPDSNWAEVSVKTGEAVQRWFTAARTRTATLWTSRSVRLQRVENTNMLLWTENLSGPNQHGSGDWNIFYLLVEDRGACT